VVLDEADGMNDQQRVMCQFIQLNGLAKAIWVNCKVTHKILSHIAA
jgi:hypothetical protein